MTSINAETDSWWLQQPLPAFSPLARDLTVDVVVVGAGVTGITAAYLLQEEGARVALLERNDCATRDSGHTTAHLTYVTDARLSELVEQLGREAAKQFWEGGAAAIDQIATLVERTGTDCEFRWVNGYLHAPLDEHHDGRERERMQSDAALAGEMGCDAQLLDQVAAMHRTGICFGHQAKFHPRKYLAGLLSALTSKGGNVFTQTELEAVEDDPLCVRANGHRIRCDYVVLATHNPLVGRNSKLSSTLLQTKLALYTSYVIASHVPKDVFEEALYWDTSDPYNYLRIDGYEDHDLAIFGGNDVKTGQESDHAQLFGELERRFGKLCNAGRTVHRWLGQVIETDDGLPFIGENAPRQFIATGFAGNGYTLGTLAAMMARDRYVGRANPWDDLFRIDRKPFHGGLWSYVSENVDYPFYLVRDRLKPAPARTLDEVQRGHGMIVAHEGHKVAAYRDDEGKLTLLSPVCSHMKCLVRWNAAARTWDCPCHGSRFGACGEVLSGPAEAPLERVGK
jgi:glycine/D-amino acid oxidase-like deaminating enzyme/nitrite reductase/ring-hydroxylating ferredoxin subunit